MKEQHKPFADIMDVFGFRIIVDRVDTCYRVLGAVHNHFIPIPGRFKDYVAIPKANGYQSLHTTLKAHSGIPLEIQIRTEEMEAMANNGIAAHWLYKSHDEPGSPTHTRAQSWMKRLLEIQQKAGNSMEFIENVKVDLFPDEAYIFTPKGDIKELPGGATAVASCRGPCRGRGRAGECMARSQNATDSAETGRALAARPSRKLVSCCFF